MQWLVMVVGEGRRRALKRGSERPFASERERRFRGLAVVKRLIQPALPSRLACLPQVLHLIDKSKCWIWQGWGGVDVGGLPHAKRAAKDGAERQRVRRAKLLIRRRLVGINDRCKQTVINMSQRAPAPPLPGRRGLRGPGQRQAGRLLFWPLFLSFFLSLPSNGALGGGGGAAGKRLCCCSVEFSRLALSFRSCFCSRLLRRG